MPEATVLPHATLRQVSLRRNARLDKVERQGDDRRGRLSASVERRQRSSSGGMQRWSQETGLNHERLGVAVSQQCPLGHKALAHKEGIRMSAGLFLEELLLAQRSEWFGLLSLQVPRVGLLAVTAHGAGAHLQGDHVKRCMVRVGDVWADDPLRSHSGQGNCIAGRCLGAVPQAAGLAAARCVLRIEAGASPVGASSTNQYRGFMQAPASARVFCSKGLYTRGASWRSLIRWLLISMTCALQGCHWPASPPAPSPTPNPHPHQTSHLKISVQEGSEVNNVEVSSIWTVGNIGCAPIDPISGAAMVKQIEVKEKVEKFGSDYIATVVDDRFLPDKCRWLGGAYEIHFMHDNQLLTVTGAGPNEFDASGKLELTCSPSPPDPECDMRAREVFDRSHFHNVFNVTLELMK